MKNPDEHVVEGISEGIQNIVPRIYDEALQPAAQELGKGLQTIAKSLNVILSPLAGMVWGFERLKHFLEHDVASRLQKRKVERIVTPSPSVAVPALAALTYLGAEEELRNLFANLLVSAMDAKSASAAHPAFVEIIKQLSAEEARILAALRTQKYFPVICEGTYSADDSENADLMLTEIYSAFDILCKDIASSDTKDSDYFLDNLLRLRLVEIRDASELELQERTKGSGYYVSSILGGEQVVIKSSRYEAIYVTKLGIRFLEMCVDDHEIRSES